MKHMNGFCNSVAFFNKNRFYLNYIPITFSPWQRDVRPYRQSQALCSRLPHRWPTTDHIPRAKTSKACVPRVSAPC